MVASAETNRLLPSVGEVYAAVQNTEEDLHQEHSSSRLHPSVGEGHTTEHDRQHSVGRYVPLIAFSVAAISICFGGFLTSSSPIFLDTLPLLGKSKKHHRPPPTSCDRDEKYSKHTLKRAYELPYAALFRDNRGQKKFEASDVTIVGDEVYSVCDSSWAISRFNRNLSPFSDDNVQVGDPNRDPNDESGYEAIFHHDGIFYVVRESIYHADHGKDQAKNGDYHAIIEELLLDDNDYTVVRECQCEFEFEGDSKGFEGAVGFPDSNGRLYTLGLCEGNHCSETKKNDVGNGRVVLMRKREGEEDCLWETVRVIDIPATAKFLDYSAIDITSDGRVAITTQEGSAVWLGHARGISDGTIDPEEFDFDHASGSVLQFPKDGGCNTIYCNIEGIHFINDEMLMAVSDKMKSKGRQDFHCFEKDQSIHAFIIP